jgi:transposase
LDVHKDQVTACVLVLGENGQREVRTREFATHWRELQKLKMWLYACKVKQVAMESTGVYWKPVWHVLEGHFGLLLANPYHMHNIPGRKTDQNDAEWIADLLAHGLLKASFVPPRAIQELRDLTRYRVKLKQEYNRVHNRVAKVLEDANIKLGSVATDILGLSGRNIIRALIAGETRPDRLAGKALSSLRKKEAELELALRGDLNAHHRFLLKELMDDLDRIESKLSRLECEIVRRMGPYEKHLERLNTIPGVDWITAWTILAELGDDMSKFPDADHAASWAGLVPGSYESAGKRKSSRARHGNCWLRRALCQSAWAVSHKKDCYLTAHFYRRAARSGMKKAILATAHQILIIAFHILRDGTQYKERGGDFYDRLNPEKAQRRLTQRLERLGWQVVLQPREVQPAEPPSKPKRGRPCKCAERGLECRHGRQGAGAPAATQMRGPKPRFAPPPAKLPAASPEHCPKCAKWGIPCIHVKNKKLKGRKTGTPEISCT